MSLVHVSVFFGTMRRHEGHVNPFFLKGSLLFYIIQKLKSNQLSKLVGMGWAPESGLNTAPRAGPVFNVFKPTPLPGDVLKTG
ncbi:hypothetical protein HanRHA438_Chr16g0762521 [Helianthus annuus]|nr:hypothetical protein HanRHA438_Chr16g0762521 [Helianthus annuus]